MCAQKITNVGLVYHVERTTIYTTYVINVDNQVVSKINVGTFEIKANLKDWEYSLFDNFTTPHKTEYFKCLMVIQEVIEILQGVYRINL